MKNLNKKQIVLAVVIIAVIVGLAMLFTLNKEEFNSKGQLGAEKNPSINEETDIERTELIKERKPARWSEDVSMITTDEGIKAPIPEGFTKLDITNNINEGIVIEDKDGNQFVWVPTTVTNFEKRDLIGQVTNSIQTLKNEPTKKSFWEDPTTEEYIDMKESVEKYGGFYIARYEASYASGDSISNYKPASKKSMTNSLKEMQYVEGTLWNFVSQEDAIQISKNMYAESQSVESHLIYAVEWDTTMQWLIDSKSKTLYEVARDSTTWGNYTNDTFSGTENAGNTGQWEETKANNIYDLAGNIWEWTYEKYEDDEQCSIRGGRAGGTQMQYPAAMRAVNFTDTEVTPVVGFRVALYIK